LRTISGIAATFVTESVIDSLRKAGRRFRRYCKGP
jgi:hypothetical protein